MLGLLITLLLGAFLLIGFLAGRQKDNDRLEHFSMAMAFGSMVLLAILELIPETLENLEGKRVIILPICIVAGIVFLKILDHFVPEHEGSHDSKENMAHIGILSALAVSIHNVIEGMTVYSLTAQSPKLGLLLAVGVGLHNIPLGMVIAATLHGSKIRTKRFFMGLSVLSTFIGGLLMMFLWWHVTPLLVGILLSFALGLICYIVVFELLPHLFHKKYAKLTLAGVAIGAGIILVSMLLG